MIENPYAHQYGLLMPDPDLLDRLIAARDEVERKRIATEYFVAVEPRSPYEFYGLMWDYQVDEYPGDLRAWILDYVTEQKRRWDPDEVACFLLEVAEDHPRFAGDTFWLKAVDIPDMLDWPNANQMLWEMFWEDRDDLVLELVYHYGWQQPFADTFRVEMAESAPLQDAERYYRNFALVHMLEAGELRSIRHQPEVDLLALGLSAKQDRRFFDAIPALREFSEACPKTIPQEIRTSLAVCYLEVGWRGLALEWVMNAIQHDLDNPELEDIAGENSRRRLRAAT